MKQLPSILAAYADVAGHLDAALEAARRSGHPSLVEKAEERQRLNDMAYFVLCWGQFEAEIDDRCRAAIRTRQASPDWATRRAWDLYNPDDKRLSGLSFPDRVALLTDRAAGRRSVWAKIMQLYEARNQIAHGTLAAKGINVAVQAQLMFQLQSQL